jgi:signal transduction histidine kinase
MNRHSFVLLTLMVATLAVTSAPLQAADDRATAQEVIAKVRQAAGELSKTRNVVQFNARSGPWVWKDTYIFVVDCDKMVNAAHPVRPDIRGVPMASIKDAKGVALYPDPAAFCEAARKPAGVWTEYWWVKTDETQGSRKISYHLGAEGTPYVVAAGIYDDKLTIAQLSKLSAKR